MSDGGDCKFDPLTGMPDENCIFIISSTNNDDVTSSYMAVPFLTNVSIYKYTSFSLFDIKNITLIMFLSF